LRRRRSPISQGGGAKKSGTKSPFPKRGITGPRNPTEKFYKKVRRGKVVWSAGEK